MELKSSVIVLVSLCLAAAEEMRSEDCAQLGLIKASLACSSCTQLDEFGLSQLTSHCLACCHNDKLAPATRRYARAVLEVCTCKFQAYPQIQAFVKSDLPAKFHNLQIKYVRGLDPIIKLMDRDGSVLSTVAIERWNTDSVVEFLQMHLEPTEDSEPDYLKTNHI